MTEGTQARPERVMVLEPDAERRQMLAQTLMQSGFRCFMADSVHDALPFYQDRQDSACMLTILNARLPWCESVELLSRAQEKRLARAVSDGGSGKRCAPAIAV